MKNKLYVLGDSFSALYFTQPDIDSPYERYRKYRGGTLPKTWSELLSEEIDFPLVNLAEAGSSNYQIWDTFCEISQKIERGDYLFIGWTDTMRFRMYSEKTKKFEKSNILTDRHLFNDISENTINEMVANRANDYWTIEIYNWEKIIRRMSEIIGFTYYPWSFFNQFPDYNILPTLFNLGATRIAEETNGEVNDMHLGEIGHQIQSKYFLDKIKNSKIV